MKSYPLELVNLGEDVYCLMSKGHHSADVFMAEVEKEYPSWPMGRPEHVWLRAVPDITGEHTALYVEAVAGSRGAFPATWTSEAYGDDRYSAVAAGAR